MVNCIRFLLRHVKSESSIWYNGNCPDVLREKLERWVLRQSSLQMRRMGHKLSGQGWQVNGEEIIKVPCRFIT